MHDYTFDVVEEGAELRVAIDLETLRDHLFVYLYDPSGAYVTKLTKYGAERRVEQPVLGTWTAKVRVYDARDTSFRMRAALDPEEGHAHGREHAAQQRAGGALLPNLQVVAPYELGFGPCQATEIANYGALRCLRFSTGPANVGEGPLDLVVPEAGKVEGPMYQRIHHDGGSIETVLAGSYEYHEEHVHYHHGALQQMDLLRVTDIRRRQTEPAGSGPKMGFCIAPYLIAEWGSFAQDPPHEIYGWFVEGNYVDFGDNPDGLYVIRAYSDPDGTIHETREDDNTSYVYFSVTGDDIEVLERGIGDSPWDPHAEVVDDNRRPTRWER